MPESPAPTPRRSLLRAAALALVSWLVPDGRRARAVGDDSLERTGEPLTTHVRSGNPPTPPLDTLVLFERGDDHSGTPMTHEVLSLIHQEKGAHSYPWTLYASLETHHEVGDACVVCSRLHKHGPGWSAGIHSEVFSHARAVGLGVNIEMSNDYTGHDPQQSIGCNIQAVAGSMQHGIQIHDGQGHFETGIGLNGKGLAGIDLKGNFTVGVNLRANSIRLNEGAFVELDESGMIRLRYRAGRIEFLNGNRCFGHLDVNGEDHAL